VATRRIRSDTAGVGLSSRRLRGTQTKIRRVFVAYFRDSRVAVWCM